MRIAAVWLATIMGCMGLFSQESPEEAFRCEGTSEDDPVKIEPYRQLPGTTVLVCLDEAGKPDGSHLERWGSSVAAEGSWKDGLKHGQWVTWRRDGAFQSSATWRDGKEEGPLLVASEDGLLLEIEMKDGSAQSLIVSPEAKPMPEWDGERRVLGERYAQPLPIDDTPQKP